jgi:hypothetical protein
MSDVNFNFGWNEAAEDTFYQKWLDESRKPSYNKDGWCVKMDDTIREQLKETNRILKEKNADTMPKGITPYYTQNSSPACFALNSSFAVSFKRQLDIQLGRPLTKKAPNPFWGYVLYHCQETDNWMDDVKVRPNYSNGGGCSGQMFNLYADYGILYYEDAPDLGTVQWDSGGFTLPMSDSAGYKWAQQYMSRSGVESMKTKYGAIAVKNQVKVIRPECFDDVVLLLKAGCTVPFGTTLAMRVGSDGKYHTGGSTAHLMAWLPNSLSEMDKGTGCGYNDYGKGSWLAAMDFTEMQKQYRATCSGCFGVLAAE